MHKDTQTVLRELVEQHGSDHVLDALACAFDDISAPDSTPPSVWKWYQRLGKRVAAIKVPAAVKKFESARAARQ